MQSRKVYVSVVAEIDEEGNKRPMSVRWEDGRVYEINKVKEVKRAFAGRNSSKIHYTGRLKGYLSV